MFTVRKPASENPQSVLKAPVRPEVIQRLEVDEKPLEGRARFGLYPYFRRVIDCVVAAALLTLSSPLLLVVAIGLGLIAPRRVFESTPKIGRSFRTFNEFSFATNQRLLRRLPVLFNILKGDLSFIGPQATHLSEMCDSYRSDPLARKRHTVRPGLISEWWIRRRAHLDYVREISLDAHYAENVTLRNDMGILLRATPGLISLLLWGDAPVEYAPEVRILDVRIDNVSMQSAIDRIVSMLDGHRAQQGCFINPHNINQTIRMSDYKKVLAEAELVMADGYGTMLAGKILRRPVRQNLCGTDLFPRLCDELSGMGKSIYLLGSVPGAAEQVADWVRNHYPDVIIKGCDHGFFTTEEEPETVCRIAEADVDLLVVAMGVPMQELFIARNLDALNVQAAIGFGGLFDYFAGRIPRAPQWVRDVGMEWLYRLVQEPRRMWRRYLIGNGLFLARVCHERLRPSAWRPSQGTDDSEANGP